MKHHSQPRPSRIRPWGKSRLASKLSSQGVGIMGAEIIDQVRGDAARKPYAVRIDRISDAAPGQVCRYFCYKFVDQVNEVPFLFLTPVCECQYSQSLTGSVDGIGRRSAPCR
jgi:hypothetical protein